MISKTRFRLTELVLAVAAIGAALLWAERTAWRQISTLRAEMSGRQTDRFRSADELRAAVMRIHEFWRQSVAQPNATLPVWIATEDSTFNHLAAIHLGAASSPVERQLIMDIEAAFEKYLDDIRSSFEGAQASGETRPTQAILNNVEMDRERLLELSEQLTAANRSSAERFMSDANALLTSLQRFLFASLVGLLVCGGSIIALIYRRTVAQLRHTLTENRVIIERQEKLASLGVFATGIAHEIRNPLTAIKVRLFTLKSSHKPGSSEHEDLEVIRTEIDRLERIVRDFLQFARPSDPEMQTMPVARLLHSAHDLLKSVLAGKGITLELDIRTDEPVRVDFDKMKQVLINFVQNGADSTGPGGTVTLRTRMDRQPLNGQTTNVVVIDICDTGKGMPPEVQKRLFDPFFTTKEKGTGLGLPIAARIVEKHGGIIQYKTELNRGTTFSIVLPLASKDESES